MPYANPDSEAAVASRRRGSRKFYQKHREAEIARCAKYNRENKESVNARAVKRRSQKTAPEKVLWCNAKNRAKAQGLDFSLTLEDTSIPGICPVLGIPLAIATGHAKDNSPSVDRIDPARGYVHGNVCVISHKANTIKSNATAADLAAVLAYVVKHGRQRIQDL